MDDYRSPPWLLGGHAQTIWPALFSARHDGVPPAFRRERWTTPDGDFIDVDWAQAQDRTVLPLTAGGVSGVDTAPARHPGTTAEPAEQPPATRAGAAGAPLLVLFHGLEGSSSSHYAQAFAARARAVGWRFAVPHFRGCSGEINLAPRAYHSGDYEEVGWILERMRREHRGPIVAAGVSLGGNALLRWAEEAGSDAAHSVSAIAAVSAPLDLAAGGHAIARGLSRQVYTRMFLRSMKPKALQKLAQHPGLFDRETLLRARTLYEFDDVFTAPLHGFRGTDDYWSRASSKPHLARIRVPALVLNARNDPFVPGESLPRQADAGPFVTLWQPAHGGHVGFPFGRWPGHVRTLPEKVTDWLGRHA